MIEESVNATAPLAVANTQVVGAGTAARSLSVWTRAWVLRLPRVLVAPSARLARLALCSIALGTFLVVAFASAGQNVLVPRSYLSFPLWESGPLHLLFRGRLPLDQMGLDVGFSAVVVILLGAYGIAVAGVRTLSLRAIWITIIALHAIVFLSPPLQLTDIFNYLGYARLIGLHHISPYTHVIADEIHDPVYRFSSWHHLRSPYGPLFSALSVPLGMLPLAVSYWLVKLGTMLSSLALIALVARCARQLGRDPRFAVVFLALNPIYVLYAMGGFHNDFFMLIPSVGAVSLLLARRDRSAGAVAMLAVAVKFTAVLLLPFLLLAAHEHRRRRDVLIGGTLAAVPLAVMSVALFGPHLPNLSDQSTLLTPFSIPNVLGLLIGVGGGTPTLLRVASMLVVACVAWLLWRRKDWISSAGWATVALIASLAWLMPWYVIWVLPLAALGASIRLRWVAAYLTVFLVATFVPVTGVFIYSHGIFPMSTPVGHASSTLQAKLEH